MTARDDASRKQNPAPDDDAPFERPVISRRENPRHRFESRVDRSGGRDACHLWTGSTAHGYGQFSYDGIKVRAHRFAYEMEHGAVRDGMCVLHDCEDRYPPGDLTNRRCVNPRHLFLGTLADNNHDKLAKGRHPMGEALRSSKLTDDQVRAVRVRIDNGDRQVDIARDFGVSQTIISRISRGVSRAYVSDEDAAR